jgi:hypothetical protein
MMPFTVASLRVERTVSLESSRQSKRARQSAPSDAERLPSSPHDADLLFDLDESFKEPRQDDGGALVQREPRVEEQGKGKHGAEKGQDQAGDLSRVGRGGGAYQLDGFERGREGWGDGPERP